MNQKYFVDTVMINTETKNIVKIINVLRDFDYTPYYDYKIKDVISGKSERVSQFILDNKYVCKNTIDMEIHACEKDKEKADARISELKWLRSEFYNKLKQVEDSKR